MRRPSVFFLIFYGFGILISLGELNTIAFVLPFIALMLCFKPKMKWLILGAVALCLGFGLTSHQQMQLTPSAYFLQDEAISLNGFLMERAILDQESAYLMTQDPVTKEKVKILVRFPYGKEPPLWYPGQGFSIKGRFTAPLYPRNPGGFDEKKWLHSKNCIGILKISEIKALPSLDQKITLVKSRWADQLVQSIIQNTAFQQGPLAAGMLFGEDSWIDEETQSLYKQSGTNHILSISGAHFAIMLLWIHYLIQKRPFRYLSRKLIVWFILLLFLWIIGWDIAAMRAFIMFLLLDLMRMGFKQTDAFNSLCLTLSILLICNPLSIFDLGLQLASMAMYALIVFAPFLTWPLKVNPQILKQEGHPLKTWYFHRLKGILVVFTQSFAVCLCLLPILRNNFSSFTWWSMIYNIPVSFMSAFILPISMVQSLLWWNEAAVQALGVLNGTFLLMMTKLVSTVEFFGESHLMPAITGFNLQLYYFCLIMPLVLKQLHLKEFTTLKERWIKTGLSICLSVMLLMIQALPNDLSDPQLRAYFLDVGQGDSTLILSPKGKVIVVDMGLNKGMVQVRDTLLKMGIDHIDLLVLSHPHSDHLGGGLGLFETMSIKAFAYYEGIYNPEETAALTELLNIAKDQGTQVSVWQKGTSIEIEDDLGIDVSYPSQGTNLEDTNDESLVFELRYKEVGILFTGDITSKVECDIIEQIQSPTWVLKAPHHGSGGSNSEALVNREGLALSVISAGLHNLYGHPKPVTLERYRQAGVPTTRTDLNGAVMVITNGKHFQYKTQSGTFID